MAINTHDHILCRSYPEVTGRTSDARPRRAGQDTTSGACCTICDSRKVRVLALWIFLAGGRTAVRESCETGCIIADCALCVYSFIGSSRTRGYEVEVPSARKLPNRRMAENCSAGQIWWGIRSRTRPIEGSKWAKEDRNGRDSL